MYDATSYVWALVLIVAIGIPLTTAIALYGGELTARMPGAPIRRWRGRPTRRAIRRSSPPPRRSRPVSGSCSTSSARDPLGGEAHVRRQGQRPLHGR